MLRQLLVLAFGALMLLASNISLLAYQPEEPAAPASTDAPADTSPGDAADSPKAEEKAATPALPWELKKETQEKLSTLIPVTGAKEVLERYNITESELFKFFNGQPLGANEEGPLLKILYHIPGLGLEWIESWRRADLSMDSIAVDHKKHQLDVIPLSGRVKRVSKKQVTPELVEQYEFSHYYVVQMAIDDSAYAAEIYARTVPATWPLEKDLDECAKVDGLFLKVGGLVAQDARLIFAAGRVRWYPDQVSESYGIGLDQIRLAKLGVDWGQFENVKKTNRQGLIEDDRESFYQVMAAMNSEEGRKQTSSADKPLKLEVLLNKPEVAQGDILPVKGFVRRITKVLIEDRDIQVRYKLEHYYQLDCFLPLGDTRLRLGENPQEAVEFNNDFPATLSVLELPPGLSPGENMREEIQIDAVFFKTWSYRSEFAARSNALQPAPMFIGFRPTHVIQAKATTRPGDLIIAVAVAATCALGIAIFWWHSQKQSNSHTDFFKSTSDTPPDFTKLK